MRYGDLYKNNLLFHCFIRLMQRVENPMTNFVFDLKAVWNSSLPQTTNIKSER